MGRLTGRRTSTTRWRIVKATSNDQWSLVVVSVTAPISFAPQTTHVVEGRFAFRSFKCHGFPRPGYEGAFLPVVCYLKASVNLPPWSSSALISQKARSLPPLGKSLSPFPHPPFSSPTMNVYLVMVITALAFVSASPLPQVRPISNSLYRYVTDSFPD